MSEKQPITERKVQGYVKEPYKKLVGAMAIEDVTSESKIVALALKELFDRMPKDRRQKLLSIAMLQTS